MGDAVTAEACDYVPHAEIHDELIQYLVRTLRGLGERELVLCRPSTASARNGFRIDYQGMLPQGRNVEVFCMRMAALWQSWGWESRIDDSALIFAVPSRAAESLTFKVRANKRINRLTVSVLPVGADAATVNRKMPFAISAAGPRSLPQMRAEYPGTFARDRDGRA